MARNRIRAKAAKTPRISTPEPNGDNPSAKIKQVASGRFGVTAEYLNQCEELEIRVDQGRGLVALRLGRADEAVTLLGRSVQADEGLWRAWLGLGQAHDRLGQSSAARRAFNAAERSAPNQAAVLNDIGMSYVSEKSPAQALEYFQRALAADPAFEIARGNIRIAKAMLRSYADAVAGTPQDKLPDVLNNVGYIAILNKDFQVADQYLRRAIDLSPVYHQAAVANLDLLARMSADAPGRQLAAAEVASDAQRVLAPAADNAAPLPQAEPAIETADAVAQAATQQAAPGALADLPTPEIQPLESGVAQTADAAVPAPTAGGAGQGAARPVTAQEIQRAAQAIAARQGPASKGRDQQFNWEPKEPAPAPQKTTEGRQFNWDDAPVAAKADAVPRQQPDQQPGLKWEDGAPKAISKATPVQQPQPESEAAVESGPAASSGERQFNWADPQQVATTSAQADQQSPGAEDTAPIETAEIPAAQPSATMAQDAVAPQPAKPAPAIERAVVQESQASASAGQESARAQRKGKELRAPLLVDGLDGEGGDAQPIKILPPTSQTPSATPRRFNWSEPPETAETGPDVSAATQGDGFRWAN